MPANELSLLAVRQCVPVAGVRARVRLDGPSSPGPRPDMPGNQGRADVRRMPRAAYRGPPFPSDPSHHFRRGDALLFVFGREDRDAFETPVSEPTARNVRQI